MNFNDMYKQSKVTLFQDPITVPDGYDGDTSIIISDKIVEYCIDKFNLLVPYKSVIDPMCGVGTIPRVINSRGGMCIGCEIDHYRFQIALRMNDRKNIIEGDYRNIFLKPKSFDCIFTSMPFSWFKNFEIASEIDESFINRFHELLKPDGFVLIDSIPEVERSGEVWQVSETQVEYFSDNGFVLSDVLKFDNNEREGETSHSVVMCFVQ